MNCIIVDDDQLARTALKKMISDVDFLDLKKECTNAVEAFNFLKEKTVDLVFLDVEMPGMSGIELIKNLIKRPIIILISSKKNYAVEAFELNVADYITKPVNVKRFTIAVEKARELYNSKELISGTHDKEKSYIFVRTNSILAKIKLNEIIYIQALGDYIDIITESKHNTVHCTLKSIEEKLPENKFYRLHRSYLVSTDHIDSVENNTAYSGKYLLPIGEQYKKKLLKRLNLI